MKNQNLKILGIPLFLILSYFFLIGILLNPDKIGFTSQELWQMELAKKKAKKEMGIAKYDKPDKFTEYYRQITTRLGDNQSGYGMNYKVEEYQKAIAQLKRLNLKKETLAWIERGPANVGGRTRALVIDGDDATGNTWFAGAATGGIWKTTNSGDTWQNLSDQFTNLAINTIAIAESNRSVIYAGTGESFPGGTYLYGNGIWKSEDKGASWQQLTSTATNPDFGYVNRLIVDPLNEDVVLAATERGIFKSTDGGDSWSDVYLRSSGVEDLVADPTDFNIQYAGVHNYGVIRSINAGNTWELSSSGLGSGTRFELAVSPVNHNNVFVSVNVSSEISNVYFSDDNGLNWKKYNDNQAFLSTQGDYDNTIVAHPYNADEVFVGGVDLWKIKFNGTISQSTPQVKSAYTVNSGFLSFVNFGGEFLGGGMSIDDGTNLVASDWASIEIRFGPGKSQRAHRFYVPEGATSGVLPANYTYMDYDTVPFEVWDITHNRQLMVSYRDQERDSTFNLYVTTGSDYGEQGREYIFVNAIEYDPVNPNASVATSGGHLYKCLYMYWTNLTDGYDWNPLNLPESKIIVDYGTFDLYSGQKTSIADSYGRFNGPNGYDQSTGYNSTVIPGLHPDHHNLKVIPKGDGNFYLIDASDGGLAISFDNGLTFDKKLNKYITTQFYGVAKNPLANEYIGGMQDNGSWQSPSGADPNSSTNYYFRLPGDGFECLWHAKNANAIIGSVYNNAIYKSTNKGVSWAEYTAGITEDDGPFITKLSASKENPDLIFAVGERGVYRSTNFGSSWTNRTISNNWKSETDGLTSSHHVKVSLANGNIVWAGAGMAKDYGFQIQVSTNEGVTFKAIPDYSLVKMDAYTSGIATHPTEDSTAFVLFSLRGMPKVLRTRDLGNNWEDISGFGTSNTSSNGFPDVVVNCLLVMPHNPNIIWVGTDIGLFESSDEGLTWHYANNGLPPVCVYQMQIVGQQVVVATHGRGIWTVDIPEIDRAPFISEFKTSSGYELKLVSNFKVSYDSVQVFVNNTYVKTLLNPATGNTDILFNVDKSGLYSAYIRGFLSLESYKSNTIDYNFTPTAIENFEQDVLKASIFPNPGHGIFYLQLPENNEDVYLQVYNLSGRMVYFDKYQSNPTITMDLSKLTSGHYLIHLQAGKKTISRKIIIN